MISGVICNKCGKSLDFFDKQEDYTIKRQIGYGSKYDGEVLYLHLCCECMDKIIDECLISPIKEKDNNT